ncbi:RNA 3'-phosphate cyclase [Stenotrophomonas panacihumi]|uniref:RNA 3'-terminal phosphate cyclase n=1 Tax=Stenotrophomonas panacihumi TaxID=676599 RepID=A0A0R0ANM8_9GAMM|nr:RNA 3'-terminal phosphate cyclase [Stenotrophomonas panacihumi]KRG46861.1 RNA 3'-phosphate cyclase [Stenotrophomonas panacihumi]PTN55992.1 RNA 3'-terminal phosphate cyclase [Stenotrophomonas panacihumi]
MEMIELEGAQGGGQLLRSALSLSLCTGIGFTMHNIRGARPRPGLMRQHLTAVQAATFVGNACVEGAALGSTSLRFLPGKVEAGHYPFAIGSAGSTLLVLQTVLPALWRADAPSTLRIEGGTHNPMAPNHDFIVDSYLPALRRLGIEADVTLEQHGFFPVGGGVVTARVMPAPALTHASWAERPADVALEARVLVSGLSQGIAYRELGVLGKRLGVEVHPRHVQVVTSAGGVGNVVLVRARGSDHVEVFSGYGERGVSAEKVADRVASQVDRYLRSAASVGEHLADQLLLPMALGAGGTFTTTAPSEHLVSNARLIEKFLPVKIEWSAIDTELWRVSVAV